MSTLYLICTYIGVILSLIHSISPLSIKSNTPTKERLKSVYTKKLNLII